ncbi:hypothetical protein DFH06DRAFT_1245145 [Mycena polygramma]|nr:hypothetical protein DFH06DRAFT_1245145 [Mycena polygramma]
MTMLSFAALWATALFAQTDTSLAPAAVYNGSYTFLDTSNIKLRIANGGAGQSGLVKALADTFIDYMVKEHGMAPFQVGWYLGDTTQSLDYMVKRQADIAITYNAAAENASLDSGVSVDRKYGFRDHFVFVGPPSNPAKISSSDTILQAFQKIVKSGADTTAPIATRFLSRYDKSATNIKESELFVALGQVPWAFAYSIWYHQYPRFPLQAVAAAALLDEYTLTDRGTLLSSPPQVTSALTKYICASDAEADRLLNPAHFLRNAVCLDDAVAEAFMAWMVTSAGGQAVIGGFKKGGKVLYSKAPGFEGGESAAGCNF